MGFEKGCVQPRKHGVSFEDAASVFNDPLSRTLADEDHSVSEQRFIDVGMTKEGRLILVAYVEREDSYRIISARKLTKTERERFEKDYYD